MPDNDYTHFAEEARRLSDHISGLDVPDPDLEEMVDEAETLLLRASGIARERAGED